MEANAYNLNIFNAQPIPAINMTLGVIWLLLFETNMNVNH